MVNTFIGYKRTYAYPNPKGNFTCTECQKERKLPANYCAHCGTESEKYLKQGLVN
jgi:predicted amidophosphoribosyltransferase